MEALFSNGVSFFIATADCQWDVLQFQVGTVTVKKFKSLSTDNWYQEETSLRFDQLESFFEVLNLTKENKLQSILTLMLCDIMPCVTSH